MAGFPRGAASLTELCVARQGLLRAARPAPGVAPALALEELPNRDSMPYVSRTAFLFLSGGGG